MTWLSVSLLVIFIILIWIVCVCVCLSAIWSFTISIFLPISLQRIIMLPMIISVVLLVTILLRVNVRNLLGLVIYWWSSAHFLTFLLLRTILIIKFWICVIAVRHDNNWCIDIGRNVLSLFFFDNLNGLRLIIPEDLIQVLIWSRGRRRVHFTFKLFDIHLNYNGFAKYKQFNLIYLQNTKMIKKYSIFHK